MADFIAGLQKANGEIPWSDGGKTDPWDHVESAMGLSVAGRCREAERAYEWMAETQFPDGSWWSATRDGVPEDKTRDSNVSSYIAVGVYHHFLITGDIGFLKRLWPTLEAGVDYAVGLQADTGEIHWARNSEGIVDPMALLTGSSSVYMSLKCAIAIAALLGKRRTDWTVALEKLGEAIRHRPNLFNMMKARYSMDWYYPVLCGAVTGDEARRRIDRSWDKVCRARLGGALRQRSALGDDGRGLGTGAGARGDRGSGKGGDRLQLDLRQEDMTTAPTGWG